MERFWEGFEWIFGVFWNDFESFLRGFWRTNNDQGDQGNFNGWMDGYMVHNGWSRPDHMPSHLDALQTMPPVAFQRLLAISIASRNWLRSTSLPGGISKDSMCCARTAALQGENEKRM